MAKASKLTIKQEKFCNKYLECGNASEAYRYAYDCSKMSDNSVWCNASQLLADTKVAQRLEYLKSHLAEASGITALQIIREHQKIAFSDATRIRNGWMSLKEFESLTDDEKACIRSVETKQTKRTTPMGDEVIDEQVKITCYDKQKALDSIVSMLGYNAPEKIANTDSTGNDIPQPTFNVERLFQLIQEGKSNE